MSESLKVLREHALSRIRQHEDNLRGWSEDGGFLLPTEPDPEERECVRRGLRAAVFELNELLKLMVECEGIAVPDRHPSSPTRSSP
jgi:hypothetical protein